MRSEVFQSTEQGRMVSLAGRIRMLWHRVAGERRRSGQEERDRFDERKRASENERRDIENRLRFLEAEASLLCSSDDSAGQHK